ncbi:hypothetical protein [Sinomonas sp. B1-1]|uniref:hypothetical protein n=1 Tax=Sinomonas sp. B1-1 TaxID=3141454 RepID=UPI003D2803C5
MEPIPAARTAAVLAAFGIVLALSGCAAVSGAGSASPTATAAETRTAAAASAAPPTATADLSTFTFTTQKLSLRYLAEWTVEAKAFPRGPVMGESAEFRDAAGKTVLTVMINATSYDVGWPVQWTVIESGALPGMAAGGWSPALQYSFFAEEPAGGGGPGTLCTLKLSGEVPANGPGTLRGLPQGGPAQGPGPGGPYLPVVELGPEVEKCGSVDGARAWWASRSGLQVKAMVLSLAAG